MTIPFPDKHYNIIYADPPWQYDDKADSGRRGACHKYPVMSIYDIMALPVKQIASKDSLLFLWSTGPMLEEAKQVMKAWGFTFRTVAFVWIKTNKSASESFLDYLETFIDEKTGRFKNWVREVDAEDLMHSAMNRAVSKGMGNYTRQNAEYVYLGSRGKNPERLDKSISQIVFAQRGRHSEKPEEVRDRIEQIYGNIPRIELFARKNSVGWDAWGNEVFPSVVAGGAT